jgi:hypothetical protein
MATTLDEINDLFLSLIQDNRVTEIYQTSGSYALNLYLEPYLLYSIDDFSPVCTQVLTYDTATQTFSLDLTQTHKNILAQIMVKYWLQREIQDLLQMRLKLQDRDFKHYSEAQNLQAKKDLYNQKQEEISAILSKYELRNTNWTDWANQQFL